MSWLLPNTNWVFIHIPKTGGTSIRHSLQKAHYKLEKFRVEETDLRKVFRFAKKENPTHIKLYEYPLIGVDYENYKYFAQVRNPFTRLVSVYFFLQQQDLGRVNGLVDAKNLREDVDFYRRRRKQYMRMGFEGFVETFTNPDASAEFINNWIVEDTSQLVHGWTLQREWLRDCPTEMKIFRLENSGEINSWLREQGFRYEYVHRKNQDIKDYSQYYTKALEKKVYRYFQDDFYRYEYSRYVPKQ